MSHHRRNKTQLAKCKRCGNCCIVWDGSNWIDCRYLVRYIGHDKMGYRAFCMIYAHRLYAITGINGQHCTWRDNVPNDYPNCPFNKGLQLHPKYLAEKK